MIKLASVAAALATLLGFGLTPSIASAKPPVWVIRDADSTIVLFGSVHILDKGRDWRPKVLDDAIANADDIWFEIPLDDAAQLRAQQLAIKRGLLPPGKSLSAMLPPADRKRLAAAAEKYRLPMAQLDHLQPWMADVTLSNAFLGSQGGMATEGVEQVLEHSVPPKVPRKSFEQPEEQVAMLADASPAAQLAGLRDTLRSLNDDPGEYRRLVDLWMKADVKGIDREAVAPLRKASPEIFATLITRRNAKWVDMIQQRLKGSGETVIVVGAGHLVGKGGVPALLRARGIKVEGP
jgi:uncharacterized protein YbaP (TraB family)